MADDEGTNPPWPAWAVTRRTVLKGMVIGAAVTFAELELPVPMRALAAGGGVPHLTVDVVRPDDFLRLTFHVTNFVLDTSVPNQPRLRRGPANVTPLVVVDLGPQHLAEQAMLTTGAQNPPPPNQPPPPDSIAPFEMPGANTGLQARLCGSSRLAFALAANVQSIPYTIAGLLDWNSLVPQLVPVAGPLPNPFKVPKIRAPKATETAIEAPWWLELSPGPLQAWAHAVAPVTHNGRTELWHSRLASKSGNTVDEVHPDGLRAVWGRDPQFGQWVKLSPLPAYPQGPAGPPEQIAAGPFPGFDGMPMRTAFTPRDRVNVVRNTSDWSTYNPQVVGSAPQAFRTRRLTVSALGADVDLEGDWPKTSNSLIEWRHRATLGRDHHVRIVNRGHLYPFGHRAVLVRESDRTFQLNNDGRRGAYLLLKFFIVVTEPVRTYPSSLGLDHGGRAFPFQKLEVVTRTSPTFSQMDPIGNNTTAFQPLNSNTPITLTLTGTDWEGNVATFASPFVFVEDTGGGEPYDPAKMAAVNAGYGGLAPSRRTADLGGQHVAFAPPSQGTPGNTAFPVQQLVFDALQTLQGVQTAAFKAASQLAAFPKMAQGVINLPTVEQLAGVAGLGAAVQFPQQFLAGGFGGQGNPGEAFLEMVRQVPLPFSTENAGGMATPKQQLSAITRHLGPVAGQLSDILQDQFKPDQVFNDLTAKILGGIPLKDILNAVNSVSQDAEKAMKYVRDQLPTEIVVRFRWTPDLKQDPLHIFEPITNVDPKTGAFVEGEAHQSTTDPNNRSWKFHGEITNFKLHLLGDGAAEFLRLDVSKLSFSSASGQKSQVDVKVDAVTFQGALKFVDQLRQYLPMLGNALESIPIPQAITASMGIAIPAIAVGIFELSNLAFSARITIPLNGDPVRVRFAFSSRQDPFLLTISCFGGGGFFAIAIGADGVEMLEIQFDFGGSLVLDVGVAKGGVDIVAGTYLKLVKANNNQGLQLTVEGFLKLHGLVNVLGIVCVTIDVYLAFQYVHKDGPPTRDIVSGRAKVTLKVEILFFSITVGVDIEESFGGDPKDPTFAQTLTANDWADYAAAFASV